MHEKGLGSKSQWGPYLSFLPEDMSHMIMYWEVSFFGGGGVGAPSPGPVQGGIGAGEGNTAGTGEVRGSWGQGSKAMEGGGARETAREGWGEMS